MKKARGKYFALKQRLTMCIVYLWANSCFMVLGTSECTVPQWDHLPSQVHLRCLETSYLCVVG